MKYAQHHKEYKSTKQMINEEKNKQKFQVFGRQNGFRDKLKSEIIGDINRIQL
jgi:hypothetical protein